jgi:hypothetical protein
MDPTTCYLEMIAAMNGGDSDHARQLAITLRDWLDEDGFYPSGHAEEEVADFLNGVLRRTACMS